MSGLQVRFPGASGALLDARLDRAGFAPHAYALFAHCFTCSKDSLAAVRISTALTAMGYAVLRFDFTGLGGSEGEFAGTGFSSNVGDLVAAADFLREQYRAPALLIGHSLGGAAVLAAAQRIPEVAAVATIAAPFDPAHAARLIGYAREQIEAAGEAEVSIGGRPFRVGKTLLDDLARQRPSETIAGLRRALLIFHSPVDSVVDISNAADIFMAAKHPKSFVSLDRADHLLTRREDAAYVADVLAAWANRYLPPAEERRPLAAEVVRVEEAGTGRYAQEIRVGQHRLIADEPVAAGGNDLGPSPYDLLLAGLGACTTMTLRMYADLKKLPLTKVSVELRHDKIHASDCETCDTKEGRIDRIERVISLEGPLEPAQRARMLEIANRCPVHRTLHSELIVPTRLDA